MERLKADYTRQLGWFDPSRCKESVTVIGAGGIGGPTTLACAKLGVRDIKVFDFDRVEAHNQPNQMYGLKDVGYSKVDSLASICSQLADLRIRKQATRVSERTPLSGIVIGAVDSMDARRAIWSAICKSKRVSLYIDGRIGGQVVRVLTVRPSIRKDRLAYESTLVPNHAVAPMKCTEAGIIDVSFCIAGLITRALRLAVVGKPKYQDLFYDHRNLIFMKG